MLPLWLGYYDTGTIFWKLSGDPLLNIPDGTIVSKLRFSYFILCNGGGGGKTVGISWNYEHEVEEEGDIYICTTQPRNFLFVKPNGIWTVAGSWVRGKYKQ